MEKKTKENKTPPNVKDDKELKPGKDNPKDPTADDADLTFPMRDKPKQK